MNEKISAYGIEKDASEKIHQAIISRINPEVVVKPLKDKMDELIQSGVDGLTNYLQDEYALVLEDLVFQRAARLVNALLKGDIDVAGGFDLVAHNSFTDGKEFELDREGVRQAIFEKFRDAIAHAEWIRLNKENEHLKEQLDWARERR